MDHYSPVARATRFVIYVLAVVVPVAIALAVVGTTPYLLDKVPEEHRGTVAAIGEGATRLSGGNGGIFRPQEANAADTTIPTAPRPLRGEWSPRRPEDYPPPAGLVAGLDYAVETTDDGYLAHWPCEHGIPVRSFDAPPGSEADLIWAVETLAFASGLPLRYTGPGSPAEKDAEGAISVTYGDHPMFHTHGAAGVGGGAVWPRGLILQGSVVIQPGQVSPFPGDPWSRRLSLHELMHAVGVDHAGPHRPEIMTEKPDSDHQTILGYGDRFAL
ncbi:hypothetical protein M3D00_06490, partial [Dietzia cinnamea]